MHGNISVKCTACNVCDYKTIRSIILVPLLQALGESKFPIKIGEPFFISYKLDPPKPSRSSR